MKYSNGETATYIDGSKAESRFDRATFGGLRAGTYLNDNVRVYANLNLGGVDATETFSASAFGYTGSVEHKYDIQNRELSFSADYLDNLFGLQNTRYFVGGTVGANQVEAKHSLTVSIDHLSSKVSNQTKKSVALMYGVQAGVIHNFSDNFSAELGYRYAVLNNELKAEVLGQEFKMKNSNQQVGYVGLNYHF